MASMNAKTGGRPPVFSCGFFGPGRKLAGKIRNKPMQKHGERCQHEQAGEHEVHLGAPIGE